ncbi:MAG: ATPase [Campylobacterales bacterium]|nr:ATPase [Campylobacterales bacterium]
MKKNNNILEQFQTFYKQNPDENMEAIFERFVVFGGEDFDVEYYLEIDEQIEYEILERYEEHHEEISALTSSRPLLHSILTGIAMGDGRMHSAFKRARVNEKDGLDAVDELVELKIIRREKPKQKSTSWIDDNRPSDKLIFNSPFLRFWFGFVSPIFKGIKDGDFSEFKKRYENNKAGFGDAIFKELSYELLKLNFKDDEITEIGSFWNKDIEIDIYAKTASGKTIVGVTKYTNAKIKKSELTKLQNMCADAKIDADMFVIVAKAGFSSELKSLKGDGLKLFTLKNFKKLI